MSGLVVIGLTLRAGESGVAAALSAVLRRAGMEPRVERLFEYDTVASPVIAARHHGDRLDPAALAERLRDEQIIAAIGGGLLAAITDRYTVRDLASELRAPVILAAAATPDATNLVRLSLAAARAARLVVPAVVLTGWPDPPSRLQLDEQRLLGEVAGTDVRTLPESPGARADAVRDWPVTDWLAAVPPEPEPASFTKGTDPFVKRGGPRGPGSPVDLEPYTAWEQRPTGDPRSTPRPRIMDVMLEIVTAEGPIQVNRACMLYNRASGGKKLTTIARAPLSSSLHWLARENRILLENEVARMPDQPPVRVRELGDRTLEEVPLDEIAELMRRLRDAGHQELNRAVLSTYGLVRLTQRADEYLAAALERL